MTVRTTLYSICVGLCDSLQHVIVLGHSKAVRDISFNNSGTQFLSAAYDRYVKLWDTETGN